MMEGGVHSHDGIPRFMRSLTLIGHYQNLKNLLKQQTKPGCITMLRLAKNAVEPTVRCCKLVQLENIHE